MRCHACANEAAVAGQRRPASCSGAAGCNRARPRPAPCKRQLTLCNMRRAEQGQQQGRERQPPTHAVGCSAAAASAWRSAARVWRRYPRMLRVLRNAAEVQLPCCWRCGAALLPLRPLRCPPSCRLRTCAMYLQSTTPKGMQQPKGASAHCIACVQQAGAPPAAGLAPLRWNVAPRLYSNFRGSGGAPRLYMMTQLRCSLLLGSGTITDLVCGASSARGQGMGSTCRQHAPGGRQAAAAHARCAPPHP